MAAAGEVEVIEERLKSFLSQLQAESGILERIVYKNKNQHRRSSYFQYLLKVRRDVKLLQSIHMEELLDSCFNVITGRKAKQKAHHLESLKRKKCDNGKFNFMERLLGAARLLSEMVEPILKTAIEISTLLARSFFMGFSLMILALLARLRVLAQQMLLDIVSIYNEISSIAQKKQSIKITQDGVEVFREYYPTMEEMISLQCVWKEDKFVLVETIGKGETGHQDESSGGGQTQGTSVRYRSIEAFLGDVELHPQSDDDDDNNGEEGISNLKRKRPESATNPSNESEDNNQVRISMEGSSLGSSSISQVSSELKPKSSASKRVAFISVTKPAPLVPSEGKVQVGGSESLRHDKENPLFNLFTEEVAKDSIF